MFTWTRAICSGTVLVAVAVAISSAALAAGQKSDPTLRRAHRRVYDEATGDWQESIPPIPGTADGDLEIARQELARRRAKSARKHLKGWLKSYPESPRQAEAQFVLAEADLVLRNYWKAYQRYERILDTYGPSEWFDRCLERELTIAEVYLSGRRRKVWGGMLRFPAAEEALEILGRIRERKPASLMAEKALEAQARYHYKKGQYAEAEDAYAQLAKDFPRGRHHALAMFRSAWAALATFPGIKFDDSALVEARERFMEFRRKYPDKADRQGVATHLDRIRDMRAHKEYTIAKWYQKVKKSDAAAFYYRSVTHNWPETVWAQRAEAQLLEMGREPPEPFRGG